MEVTKYAQSCLVVAGDAGRLLIDPGGLGLGSHTLDDVGDVDAVLYTHQHPDHFDPAQVDALRERGVTMYGNADVCGLVGDGANEVRDGETFEVAGFAVTARDLPHVEMVDGSPGPPNTGYVIDGRFFHPGDGTDIELEVDDLALPIAGPSISFRDAYRMTAALRSRRVIPIHYDFFVADPARFPDFCDIAEVIILGHGESTDLG